MWFRVAKRDIGRNRTGTAGCRWGMVLALALSLLSTLASAAQGQQYYRFGVFPHMPPSKLLKVFSPIAEDFTNQLDYPVQISSASTYERFMKALEEEHFDIAFVQPFDYVWAHDDKGYLPLARRSADLSTIIIVGKESPVQQLEELRGKVIANPAEVSAVSKLTTVVLREAGLGLEKEVTRAYGKSHFSCMQAVLIGRADACGTARRALAHFEEKEMEERFRIIAESEPYPHALFVVHPRVPAAEREKLKQAILSWPEREEGQQLLKQGNLVPFVEALDQDYDRIRQFEVGG